MTNSPLLILFFLFSLNIYSQSKFEPGYLVFNDGLKTEVLILNMDWRTNPREIQYRISENSELETASLQTVQEFHVGNSKFVRHEANVDFSSNKINDLSKIRAPEFRKEKHFFRVLVEGEANLYSLKSRGDEKFFYSTEGGDIEQLIYKKYNEGDGKIKYNTGYQQQLWNNLQCSEISLPQINNTEYTLKHLEKLFIDYNECKNADYFIYNEKSNPGRFKIGIKGGVNFTNFHLYQDGYYVKPDLYTVVYHKGSTILKDSEFEPQIRLGLELEYILPFNHGKWAIFLVPTYIPYKTEKEVFLPGGRGIDPNPVRTGTIADFVTFKYSAIELPVGVRYYLFLKNNASIFFNGGAGYNFHLNSSTIEDFGEGRTRERPDFEVATGKSLSLLFGLGYTHNSGFSIEARFYPLKEVTDAGTFRLNHNNSFSLIAGYKFL